MATDERDEDGDELVVGEGGQSAGMVIFFVLVSVSSRQLRDVKKCAATRGKQLPWEAIASKLGRDNTMDMDSLLDEKRLLDLKFVVGCPFH